MAELLGPLISSPLVKLVTQLCVLFLAVLWIAIVFWTYRDARRRGAMGWFWALATIVFFPLFPYPALAVYLVVRPPELMEDVRERDLEIVSKEMSLTFCPGCEKPVEGDFLICPYCLKKLKKQCTSCGRALHLAWGVCPYCKTKQ